MLADHAEVLLVDLPAAGHALEQARRHEAHVHLARLHLLHDARHRIARDADLGEEGLGVEPLADHLGGGNLPAREGGAAHDGDAPAAQVLERPEFGTVGAHDDRRAVGVVGVGRLVRDDGRKRQPACALDHEAREAARGDRHVEAFLFGRLQKAVGTVDLHVDLDRSELLLHGLDRAAVVVVHDRHAVGVDDRKPEALDGRSLRLGGRVGAVGHEHAVVGRRRDAGDEHKDEKEARKGSG